MRPTINPLTSLRGIAALLVVVNHMTLLMLPLGLTPAKPTLTKTGILGMTTFFVLSGFVMYYNYAHRIAANRSEGILQFVFARVARLYPLLIAYVLFNFILNVSRSLSSGDASGASLYVTTLPLYLIGVQSWLYAVINDVNVTASQYFGNPAWSVSTELFFYVLFIPLIAVRKESSPSISRGLFVALASPSLPPGKVEILVSDNHSTDETPDTVADIVEAGLPVRYIRNEKGVGSDANIAQCFNEAHGDYVQIMGDDDLYVRGTLARVVSLLESNDYGVLCLRPFGYDNDPDGEYPGRTGSVREFLEAGKFLRAVGPLVTFISAMVVNRRIQPDVDAREFCGSNLVQVHLVVHAAILARKNAFLTEYMLACKRNNSGGYGAPEIFVERLGRILDSYRASGLTDEDIRKFETRMLLSHHPFYLLRQRIANRGSLRDTHRRFNMRFAKRAMFHIWVAPIMLLPRPMAVVWGSFATLTGRILNGDLRRGITFALHRLTRRN
jgi:glycosyltransferase involved in cell wall biosynthesis